ncbi:MAG: hypothetical protein HYS21_11505 [Deltaproteobacteria bacterium]|nr:hypothetical protein [Deltaproteobacteria bacterium]
MFKIKAIMAMMLFFAITAAASLVEAVENRIPLKGQLWEDAKGEAIVEDYRYQQQQITIDAVGLEPNAVYTVWLVNEGREAQMGAEERAGKAPAEKERGFLKREEQRQEANLRGLGVRDYSFKTDAAGHGRFVATVNQGELHSFDSLEVAHHPNGDPKDLNNAVIALRGDLPGR